jgi:membrane-anchored protein YejM (alkaline phosphatase superfamily)
MPIGVTDRYFAMPNNLEAYIRSKSDPAVYAQMLNQISAEFVLNAAESLKSPIVAASLFTRLIDVGVEFPELDDAFARINKLAGIG